MRQKILQCFIICISATVLGFGSGTTVQAQEASDEGVLEEILVTARKREENLQEVPVTIAAFTEDDIDRIGVSSMRDYAKLIPNFFLVETQNQSFTFINIRGITQMRNTDPSVAVVVDGVLSTTPISLSQELFDIQQIEVYKGPQGALYGRNAMAGAINITTKRPSNELEGFIRAGAGNGSAYKFQGAVSGPLIENSLFGRISASYYDSDGVRDNVALDKNADPKEDFSVRGRLIWDASEEFEADFRISYSEDTASALSFTDISPIIHETSPGSGIILGSVIRNPITQGPFFFCPGPPCGFLAAGGVGGGDPSQLSTIGLTQDELIAASGTPGVLNSLIGNVNNTSIPLNNNLNGIDKRKIFNASLLLKWETGIGTLTSVTSYDDSSDLARGEQPPRTPVFAQINSQYRDSQAWSQEIRLTSPDDQRFRWIVGAYYVHTDAFLSTTVQRDNRGIDTLDTFIKTDPSGRECLGPTVAFEFEEIGGQPNPFFIPGQPLDCVRGFDGDGSSNTAYAVFAQANYDLTEEVELSFSLRYDRDERDQIVRTPNRFLSFGSVSPLRSGDVRGENFDSLQPKGTIRWTPKENLMLYASYAEGFRSGGFNRPGIGARADQLRSTGDPNLGIPPLGPLIQGGIQDIYPQQDTRSIEGGFKYTTPNGKFVANASVFYTKVDNYQSFTFNAFLNASQVIIPIDEVELKGFEIDTSALLAEGLSINVGFGLTDSEITKDNARGKAFFGGTLGNKAPQTPEYTLNVALNFERPINLAGSDSTFFARVDYQRIGQLYFMPENFSKRDPLDLLNARIGVNLGDGWQVAAWGKNLTDENYFAEGFNPNGLFFYGKLRQYGIEITKRFSQ